MMCFQGNPILALAAHQPQFLYYTYTGYYLPYNYSSQHNTHLPQQTEQDIHTSTDMEDIDDNIITDNVRKFNKPLQVNGVHEPVICGHLYI